MKPLKMWGNKSICCKKEKKVSTLPFWDRILLWIPHWPWTWLSKPCLSISRAWVFKCIKCYRWLQFLSLSPSLLPFFEHPRLASSLLLQLRLTFNFWSSCYHLPSSGIPGVCPIPGWCAAGYQTQGFYMLGNHPAIWATSSAHGKFSVHVYKAEYTQHWEGRGRRIPRAYWPARLTELVRDLVSEKNGKWLRRTPAIDLWSPQAQGHTSTYTWAHTHRLSFQSHSHLQPQSPPRLFSSSGPGFYQLIFFPVSANLILKYCFLIVALICIFLIINEVPFIIRLDFAFVFVSKWVTRSHPLLPFDYLPVCFWLVVFWYHGFPLLCLLRVFPFYSVPCI